MFRSEMALLRLLSEVPSLAHLLRLSDIFSEWHRVLKPDGLILIAVPDMAVLARFNTFLLVSLANSPQVDLGSDSLGERKILCHEDDLWRPIRHLGLPHGTLPSL